MLAGLACTTARINSDHSKTSGLQIGKSKIFPTSIHLAKTESHHEFKPAAQHDAGLWTENLLLSFSFIYAIGDATMDGDYHLTKEMINFSFNRLSFLLFAFTDDHLFSLIITSMIGSCVNYSSEISRRKQCHPRSVDRYTILFVYQIITFSRGRASVPRPELLPNLSMVDGKRPQRSERRQRLRRRGP